MQYEKSWTITKFEDGEATEVIAGATHAEALSAISQAMYGEVEAPSAAAAASSVHELPLAA
jgi:hypothetical protein